MALFAAFAGYNYWRLLMGIDAPCGCFSALFTMSAPLMLLFDLSLAGIALVLLCREIQCGSGATVHEHHDR